MKWNSGNVLLVVSLFAVSNLCFSAQSVSTHTISGDQLTSSSGVFNAKSPGMFLSVGGGEQFYKVSGTNLVGTGAGWPPDRYPSDSMSNQPYFYFAGGYTLARQNEWLPYYSVGLRYTYSAISTVSGYIDQYSLPDFNNYNFQYDVQVATVLATFKADIYRYNNFMPYLIIGLGVSDVTAKNYREQPLGGVTPRVNPDFGKNTVRNFTPSFGAGVDYILLDNIWLNFEVNYNDIKNVNTGNGANYSSGTGTNYSNESLHNSIYSTSALIGVTYYPG